MTSHREERVVPYTPQQMYDLVADVAAYPAFLPWCVGARVGSSRAVAEGVQFDADLVISFKVFRESYRSRVVLRPEVPAIDVRNIDGPFRRLTTNYTFHPHDDGCRME